MQKRNKVALLLESSREFGRALMNGFIKYSHLHGPWHFYMPTAYRFKRHMNLRDWHPDAILTRDFKNRILPAIVFGIPDYNREDPFEPRSAWPRIIGDNEAYGNIAAEHFLEKNFYNFAFCTYPDLPFLFKRGHSFEKRLSEAGFSCDFYVSEPIKHKRSWTVEQKKIIEWLNNLPKPVGILAGTDDIALGILETSKQNDFRIPEDIAILGLDNDPFICEMANPALSSIAIDFNRGGLEAAQLLDRLMSGEEVMDGQKIVLKPSHIVTRQSTDITVVNDSTIVEAIRFIRNNIKTPLQASDVANGIGVSRSVLYRRFSSILGRSVYDEIKNFRIKEIRRFLVESDFKIEDIAIQFGYESGAHIARYFRSETGMTPKQFRNKHKKAGS